MLTYHPVQFLDLGMDSQRSFSNLVSSHSTTKLKNFLLQSGYRLSEQESVTKYPTNHKHPRTVQLKLVWKHERTRDRIISPIYDPEVYYGEENGRNSYTLRCYKIAAIDLWFRSNQLLSYEPDRYQKWSMETPIYDIPKESLLYMLKCYTSNFLWLSKLVESLGFTNTCKTPTFEEYSLTQPELLGNNILPYEVNRFPIRLHRCLYRSDGFNILLLCHIWRRLVCGKHQIDIMTVPNSH